MEADGRDERQSDGIRVGKDAWEIVDAKGGAKNEFVEAKI